jgi:hypothetical protein
MCSPGLNLIEPWNDLAARVESNVFMHPAALLAATETQFAFIFYWHTTRGTTPRRPVGFWRYGSGTLFPKKPGQIYRLSLLASSASATGLFQPATIFAHGSVNLLRMFKSRILAGTYQRRAPSRHVKVGMLRGCFGDGGNWLLCGSCSQLQQLLRKPGWLLEPSAYIRLRNPNVTDANHPIRKDASANARRVRTACSLSQRAMSFRTIERWRDSYSAHSVTDLTRACCDFTEVVAVLG